MFYTYAQTFKSRVFMRGYKDGKRFGIVYGGLPVCDGVKDIDDYRDPNNFKHDIFVQNAKFYNHRVSSYIAKSDYLAKKQFLDLILRGAFTCPTGSLLNCQILETDKVDIHDKEMIELKYPINQDDAVRKTLASEYIDLYDDIEPSVKYMTIYQNRLDWQIDYSLMKIAFLDIETEQEKGKMDIENAPERINVITLKVKGGKIYTFCLGEYHNDSDNIEVFCFNDEKDLLRKFIQVWNQLDIDSVSGWNSLGFDIPYIVNRCKRVLGYRETLKLSPFKFIERKRRLNKFGREYYTYNILGINHQDYMELYLKFTYATRESYSLNNICQIEIGKGKLNYDEYGSLKRLYKDNFPKFVDYNIRDVTLLEELDSKLNLITLANHIAYKCHCGIEDIMSPIKSWDSFIYSEFVKKGYVLRPRQNIEVAEPLMGGYVKLPTTGLYNWIVSFDVNSLYPTIIRQLNISPETLTDEVDTGFEKESTYSLEDDIHRIGALIDCTYDTSYLKERNLCLTCNGNLIKRDKKGFLPEMIGDLYNNRVEVKGLMKKYQKELEELIKDHTNDIDFEERKVELEKQIATYKNEQTAIKVLMNSLYGQLGNKYCRWYDIRIPRSITKTGQTMIRYIARRMNEFLNAECGTTGFDYVAAVDTDSNYLNLENVVKSKGYKTADELNVYIEEVLEPYIDKCFHEFYDYMNHFDFQIKMKREVIADRGLFINKKKRYCLSVIDNEGVRYAEPHLKIMGLEVIKSSTPEGVRTELTEVLKIMLYKTRYDLVNYIDEFRERFKHLPPEKIAINKRVNAVDKWLVERRNKNGGRLGVPINSQASINYNKLIEGDFKYLGLPKIEDGDKIKYIYLKDNPYGFSVIGFIDYLPKELGMEKYIDYEKQFEKVFLENVKNITDDFNYNLDVSYSLDDLL